MKKFICLLLCILVFQTILVSCDKNSSELDYTDIYHSQMAVKELSNGWNLFVEYTYMIDENGKVYDESYYIDAVNLKYKELSNFDIACIDSNTNSIVGYVEPQVHYMSMNPSYKSTIDSLYTYFEKRKRSCDLKEEELDFVEKNDIYDKHDIIELYNESIKKGDLSIGNFMNLSESDLLSENEIDGYKFQAAYFLSYGNIAKINIELIYADGTHLSDINNYNLTEEQKIILEDISNIEKEIIEKQTFNITGYETNSNVKSIDFRRLFNLLKQFGNEEISND